MNIKCITISIFILAYAQAATFVLTVQKVSMFTTKNDAEQLTFGFNWALDSGKVATLSVLGALISNPVTRLYNSAGSVIKTLSFKSQFVFGYEAETTSSTAYYAMINTNNKLKLYGTNSLTQIVVNGLSNQQMTNAKVYKNFALTYNSNLKVLYFINMQSKQYQTATFNSYNFIDLSLSQSLSILYVADQNLTYRILMFPANVITSTPQNQIILIKPAGTSKGRIFYQSSTKLLGRFFSQFMQIYNTTQKNLYRNLSLTGPISNAILCNRYIIISILNKMCFYDIETLQLSKKISYSTISIYELKCFEDRNLFAASYYINNTNPLSGIVGGTKKFEIHYYLLTVLKIQQQNQPEQPSSQQQHSQQQTQNVPPVIVDPQPQEPNSQNQQNPIEPSDQVATPTKQPSLVENISDLAASFLKDKNTKQTLQITSTFAGALSLLSFGHHLMRPLLNFLEDFWYYQFHIIQYPQIVQIFTKEVDLLNEFRISPQFLNFQFQVNKFNEQSDQYVNVLKLHDRQPQQIYVFQSLKSVYMNNFIYSIVCFVIIKMVTKIIKNCCQCVNPTNKIIYQVYKYLSSSCYWWCLLVTCIEANISVISFFTSVQFNVFSSFEFIDLINLLTCLFLMFLPVFYSFSMYVIIFSSESKSKTNDLFGLSKFSKKGLALQMSLNCICPYLQAFSHGIFINRHFLQIISLAFVDILQISLMVYFRKQFNYKIDLVVYVLYKIMFFAFNVTIFLFSFYGDLEVPFNFIFLIIICLLVFLTICKFLVSIGQMIYEKCKSKSKKVKEKAINNKDSFEFSSKTKTNINSNVFQVTTKNIDDIQRRRNQGTSFKKQKVKKQKYLPNRTLFMTSKKSNKVTFIDEQLKTDSNHSLIPQSRKQETSIKLIDNKSIHGNEDKKRETKSKIKTIKLTYFGKNKKFSS